MTAIFPAKSFMGDADLCGLDGLDPEQKPAPLAFDIISGAGWNPFRPFPATLAVFPQWRVADIRFPLRL
jgi:hypothetical protein